MCVKIVKVVEVGEVVEVEYVAEEVKEGNVGQGIGIEYAHVRQIVHAEK